MTAPQLGSPYGTYVNASKATRVTCTVAQYDCPCIKLEFLSTSEREMSSFPRTSSYVTMLFAHCDRPVISTVVVCGVFTVAVDITKMISDRGVPHGWFTELY